MSLPPGPIPQPDTGPPHLLDQDDVAALLVGQFREFSRTDVTRLSGVSVVGARKFWHALGFPLGASSERLFTEADLRALRRMAVLVRGGVIDERTALALTRALARTADRLAAWQVQLLAESVADRQSGRAVQVLPGAADPAPQAAPSDTAAPVGSAPRGDPARSAGPETSSRPARAGEPAAPEDALAPLDARTAQDTARLVLDLAGELEPMLVYAWRRHLNDAVARLLADASPGHDTAGMVRVVGFADLVAFSSLVRQRSERDVALMVERFEALASDIVTAHGGRVVKTVGDEVLFACVQPAPGAAIALDLVDALDEDPMLPEVRVGCAYGPVLARLGDVFGITVNRAARLTPLAHPGSVLIDGPLAAALASQSGFDLTPMRRRSLRGVGAVTPHVLVRPTSSTRRGRYP